MLALQLAIRYPVGRIGLGLAIWQQGLCSTCLPRTLGPYCTSACLPLGGYLDAELRANVERDLRLIPLQGSSPKCAG